MRKFMVASALWLSSAFASFAACSTDRLEIKGDWGQATFQVEIADDEASRSQGLMHREFMASTAGMLFVYNSPRPVAFWMRNTLIPLDMIFIDETGRVEQVHQNAVPLDETPIPGGDAIQFVLEIKGGMAAVLQISQGSVIRHPAIPEKTAVWPCPQP